jgi:imidazole glycerol-phosphate synthase subunit HisF
VVLSMDVKRECGAWKVYVRGGRNATGLDAVAWAKEGTARGAGEILLTSIDRDGTCSGFDCELSATIAGAVRVPVIASGGARTPEDFLAVFAEGRADAALAASIFHGETRSISALKKFLAGHGVPVRLSR